MKYRRQRVVVSADDDISKFQISRQFFFHLVCAMEYSGRENSRSVDRLRGDAREIFG